jgi:CRP/FNR family transcriptional regulator, cyclic AMP receptor protein
MVNTDAAERFMAAPWLESTDRKIKQELLDSLAEERAPKGAILLAQGQMNDRLTFVIEGSVLIDRLAEGGRRDVITTLSAPAVFGTTSFFQPKAHRVTVHAVSDVRLLTLSHASYEQLRREHPRAAEALALAVVRAISERFDLIDKLFAEHMAKPPGSPTGGTSEWSSFRARLFEEHTI